MSHITSAQAGLEAQLASTKMQLGERNTQVANLENQVAEQMEKIAALEAKVVEGECLRRKLHNQVQELKVCYILLCDYGVPC